MFQWLKDRKNIDSAGDMFVKEVEKSHNALLVLIEVC